MLNHLRIKRLYASLLKASLRTEWPNSVLLFALVVVFAFNAIGVLEFHNLMPGINVRGEMFTTGGGAFALPPIATSAEFMIMLVSGLMLALLLPLLSPISASVLVLLLALPPIWLAVNFPYRTNVIPMQFSLLMLLMQFGINVLLKYFAETQQKQKLLDTFSQFVPPELVGELSHHSKLLALSGESKYLTVFFCDLRNFTAMSEQLDPKEVVRLLNEYFTVMTTILYKYGATIDKYIGDSIMAFWGAPLPQEDHVSRAVAASFEMHRAMHKLAAIFHARGLPSPTIGIGINSGVVNVGNMGSRYRLAYTVIGDAVNLAFRLQAITRDYRVPTIVGENTAKNCTDMVFRELDTVMVKGKTLVSRMYEPVCAQNEVNEEMRGKLARHQQALEAWYAHDNDKAAAGFNALLQDFPSDSYYRAMLEKLARRQQALNAAVSVPPQSADGRA